MNYVDDAISAAIQEVQLLRKRTKEKATPQVRGAERDIVRATALSWFNKHKCDTMLQPPWGYEPKTAVSKYESGMQLPIGTIVTVNEVVHMPNETDDPHDVWARVGPK